MHNRSWRPLLSALVVLLSACSLPPAGTGRVTSMPIANAKPETYWSITRLAAAFHPRGLAVSATGGVYFTNKPGAQLKLVSASGGTQTVAKGFKEAWGLGADSAGTIYVADYGHAQIVRVRDGKKKTVNGLWQPTSVQLDASGNIYAYSENDVIKYDRRNHETRTIFSNNQCDAIPGGLAVSANGTTFVSCDELDSVYEIAADGNVTTFCSGLFEPEAITADKSGDVYVMQGGSELTECTAQGAVVIQDVPRQLGYVSGLAWYDGLIYATSFSNYIVKLTPSTNRQALVGKYSARSVESLLLPR
jgi:hypothetical protein